MAKAPTRDVTIEIDEIETREITFCVRGTSPLIMNRFQQKAWQELLFPSRKANRAERDQNLKHDPFAEFRGGVYRNRDPKAAALIHIPNGAFHGALAWAALDLPGATKAKIERLTSVVDVNINLFGVPHIFCAMVRSSDMNKTPDVRTRPIFPEWACKVTVQFVKKLLTERAIGALFGGAGQIIGIGDWRPQKRGPYGRWTVCAEDDPEFRRIVSQQGRAAQERALAAPIYYDEDTAELLTWFNAELVRRERGGDVEGAGKAARRPRVKQVHEEAGASSNTGDRTYLGINGAHA